MVKTLILFLVTVNHCLSWWYCNTWESNRNAYFLCSLIPDNATSTKTPGRYCEISDFYQTLPGNNKYKNFKVRKNNTLNISHVNFECKVKLWKKKSVEWYLISFGFHKSLTFKSVVYDYSGIWSIFWPYIYLFIWYAFLPYDLKKNGMNLQCAFHPFI